MIGAVHTDGATLIVSGGGKLEPVSADGELNAAYNSKGPAGGGGGGGGVSAARFPFSLALFFLLLLALALLSRSWSFGADLRLIDSTHLTHFTNTPNPEQSS